MVNEVMDVEESSMNLTTPPPHPPNCIWTSKLNLKCVVLNAGEGGKVRESAGEATLEMSV